MTNAVLPIIRVGVSSIFTGGRVCVPNKTCLIKCVYISVQVILAEHKETGQHYALKVLEKRLIIVKNEVGN